MKKIVFSISTLFAILAMAAGFVAVKNLLLVRPASDYTDRGIFTFRPYRVLPIVVKNTSPDNRNRRLYPTKVVYMVYYRATEGKGYEWSEQALTQDIGQRIVDAGIPVERRVLSIPSDKTYITIEPNMDAESYTASLKRRFAVLIGVSAVYIVVYIATWIVILMMKQKQKLKNTM